MRNLTFKQRQLAVGLCGGMSRAQIGKALGLGKDAVDMGIFRLLNKTGMSSRFEFALTQNAAVRDLIHPEEPE